VEDHIRILTRKVIKSEMLKFVVTLLETVFSETNLLPAKGTVLLCKSAGGPANGFVKNYEMKCTA